MEVGVKCFKEDFKTLNREHIFSAYFTFVAIDETLKAVPVCPAIPATEEERRRYMEAEERRKRRFAEGSQG
jgi:acyl-CoA hydrolase